MPDANNLITRFPMTFRLQISNRANNIGREAVTLPQHWPWVIQITTKKNSWQRQKNSLSKTMRNEYSYLGEPVGYHQISNHLTICTIFCKSFYNKGYLSYFITSSLFNLKHSSFWDFIMSIVLDKTETLK